MMPSDTCTTAGRAVLRRGGYNERLAQALLRLKAATTAIEWAHFTFNPWIGCMKVSEECRNCYAEQQDKFRDWSRDGLKHWGADAARHVTSDGTWAQPRRWNKIAAELGVRFRVFCASLADVFEDRLDLLEPRHRLWALIRETPHLDWLLLTKRPENMLAMLPPDFAAGRPWVNVWLGTSAGDQAGWYRRVGHLVDVPAHVRFVSAEPLLGRLHSLGGLVYLDWMIVGGESGPNARSMHPDWPRDLRDACKQHGVAFFFKQWGEFRPHGSGRYYIPPSNTPCAVDVTEMPMPQRVVRLNRSGKRHAGRELDGRTWDEVPGGHNAGK